MLIKVSGFRFLDHSSLYADATSSWLTGDTALAGKYSAKAGWDWDEFADFVVNASLAPALQPSLRDSNSSAVIPEEIRALVTVTHDLNVDRNKLIMQQVEQLAAGLNRVGIQPVALKGVANILAGIYPSLGSRYLSDIDFLIPHDAFPQAVSIFSELGYRSDPKHPIELRIGHTYPPLTRPLSVEVDLHRNLGLGVSSSFLSPAELLSQSSLHDLGGAAIRIPSPDHLVIHHIMHSQMHDSYRERLAPSLRTLYDFGLLRQHLASSLDWPGIEAHFRDRGQYPTLALYLLEAEKSFGLRPPLRLEVTSWIRWRQHRRNLLRRWHFLRFVDPFYYLFALFKPRTRRLREILSQPDGMNFLMGKLRRRDFYARIRSDFM